MKKHLYHRAIIMALLLTGVAGSAWAVNTDISAPCWRDGSGTTRQFWDFESSANPINPSSKANQPGIPTAQFTVGTGGSGHWTNNCIRVGTGCGTAVYAVLPLVEDPCDGSAPYESNLGQLGTDPDNSCVLTQHYTDPPPYGTAYGWWDVGTTGQKVLLTIPNSGAPAGTMRYFNIQATYMNYSGVAGYPGTYALTNGATTPPPAPGNTTTGTKTRTQVEQDLDKDGDLRGYSWYNERLVMKVAADTSAGNDTLTIRGSSAFWIEGIIIETLDRVAVSDLSGTPKDTITNIPFATLLGNDRGAASIAGVGSAVNGTVSLPGGSVVRFEPTPGFTGTASFWYTNNDCASLTNMAAQVTVDVIQTGPVANVDTYYRCPGASLKINKADLLANDQGNGLTFAGLTLTTTNGVTVMTNATTIFYSNANNVNDRLTYNIRDNQATAASAYVLIQMVAGTSTNKVSLQVNVPGPHTNTLTLAGIPDYQYVVQFATNLPANPWFNLSTNTAGSNGLWTVLDLTATNVTRYYRVSTP
jgi:hypothetical protein